LRAPSLAQEKFPAFRVKLPKPSLQCIRLILVPLAADLAERQPWTNPVNMNDPSSCSKQICTVARLAGRFIALLAVGALSAFLLGCSSAADSKQQKAQAAGPRSVSVAVATVQRQDVPVYLSGLGAVTAFNTANIKSRVDGQIMKVSVREGQNVNEGDLLIEIDARPFEVQLEQMQAQLFRDQAQLRDAKLNLDRYTSDSLR